MVKKGKIVIPGILIVLLIAGVVGYYVYQNSKSLDTLSIEGVYDNNKQPIIGTEQAVIGGVEGVKYIKLQIQIENKDTVPLNFKIISSSPIQFTNSLSTITFQSANPGEKVTWISDFIDVVPLENTTQNFSITIEASSALRTAATKTSQISVKIDKDPVSQFDVNVISDIDNTANINPLCTETWSCDAWSSCVNSQQTRICEDTSNCGTTSNKPSTTQSCVSAQFETNAVGSYSAYSSGTWIKLDYNNDGILEQYNYASNTIGTSCSGSGTFAFTTSEGYSIKWYTGSSGLSMRICNPSVNGGYKVYN